MHRRYFLSRSLLALTAAGLAPHTRAAAASGLQLGFSLYGMKTVRLEKALQTCSEIGYQNVELSLSPGWATEPKLLDAAARQALRRQLDANHLAVSAVMLNLSLAVGDEAHAKNLEALKEAAQLSHDLFPENPPLLETVMGGKAAEWDKLKDGMLARLQSWAETAAAAKVIIAIKGHAGSAVNTPERLQWLLERVPSPAICVDYDYSHFQVAGLSLEESLRPLVSRTRFIHVKDAEGTPEKFKFLLPGQGHTDYPAYFKLLQSLGYQGPVVVEVSAQVFNQPGYDPLAAARQCYATLHAALPK